MSSDYTASDVLLAGDVVLTSYGTTSRSSTAELKAVVHSMNEFCTVTIEGPAVLEFLRKVKLLAGNGERRILRLSTETTDRVTP